MQKESNGEDGYSEKKIVWNAMNPVIPFLKYYIFTHCQKVFKLLSPFFNKLQCIFLLS